MASYETLLSKILGKTPDDVDHHHVYDHDHEHEHNPIHGHPQNLSRLSVCSSSFMSTNDEEDHDGLVHDVDIDDGHAHVDEFDDACSHDEWNDAYANGMRMFISRLSIESFDGDDADEEFSDENNGEDLAEMSADSDDEQECYSLPTTPPRGRRARTETTAPAAKRTELGVKEYASENEAQKGVFEKRNRKNSRRRIIRERGSGNGNRKRIGGQGGNNNSLWSNCNSFSGESEGSGGGGCGLVPLVITRPKGGRRSLCMDLEEVKACRDLGFELEHERMVEIPTGKSVDTSSGGDSPIANWRISSPGDDPRDVKARLKVWAQAVALASSSSLPSN